MKHFRRGLMFQRQRAVDHIEALDAERALRGDEWRWAAHRMRWVLHKKEALDTRNLMIQDRPAWHEDDAGFQEVGYGSMCDCCAVRKLSNEEILWNNELIEEEVLATLAAERFMNDWRQLEQPS